MAKCKWCDKGGLFQKVDKVGLCKECGPTVTADIEKHSNVIYEAMHVFERAVDPKEKAANCDLVVESARHLLRYETKGLETCSPPAKLVLDEYSGFRKGLGSS